MNWTFRFKFQQNKLFGDLGLESYKQSQCYSNRVNKTKLDLIIIGYQHS